MHPKMRAASFAAAVCLAAQARADTSASEPSNLLTARVIGEVTVGTDGIVEAYTIHTPLPADLRAVVDKAVATWRFAPIRVDGAPARARSDMHLSLVAERHGEVFATRVENVVFHDISEFTFKRRPWRFVKRSKPAYPLFQVEGVVTVAVRIGPDGHVTDAEATQCSLFAIEGRTNKARACETLSERSARAARTFVVDTRDHRKPKNVEWLATVPFHFQWGAQQLSVPAGQWRREWRTAYVPPAWHSTGKSFQRVGTADVADEGLVEQGELALRVDQQRADTSP